MPTWADLFAQRPALLVNGWTANHDYAADLVAERPEWGTGSGTSGGAGGDIIQVLQPTGFTDLFAAEVVVGQTSGSVEPDWAGVPNVGDETPGDGTLGSWLNIGQLTALLPILPWATDTIYSRYGEPAPVSPVMAAVTSSANDGHIYLAYPRFAIDTTGASEPDFPTDGSYVADTGGSGFWLDLGAFALTFVSARVSVGFSAGPLDPYPEWTALDDVDNLVTGYTINRGRTDTLDRTGTGTAGATFTDSQGILDPTNTSGPYYNAGKFLDGKQAAIALQNPCTGEWSTLFRGIFDDPGEQEVYFSRLDEDDDPTGVCFGNMSMVDGLDYLANVVLNAGDSQATPPHAGDVVYIEDTVLVTAAFRIGDVLEKKSWPVELTRLNSGNVRLQQKVYATGTPALNVIDDACDAEFPGIANRYIDKEGVFRFVGRLQRFDALTNPDFGVQQWKVGDGATVNNNLSYAQMRSLAFGRPRDAIINSAQFTPQGIADSGIDDCLVTDPTSIGLYGERSKAGIENLLVLHDNLTGNNAKDTCIDYGSYWVAARKDPKTRISSITIRSLHPDDPRAPAVWRLLCGIDISDIVILKCATPRGGFDDAMHFVEGLSYQIGPARPEYDNVTLTLMLTPQDDFDYAWT